MTNAQRHKIVTLRRGGMSQADVAKKLRCSGQAVSYWEKKLSGSKISSNGSIPTKPQPVARKAKALVPTSFSCPHCGGPLLK